LDENEDQDGVRLHLAALLVDQEPGAALDHATHVLARRPDDVVALRIASAASRGLGDHGRAERYDRLISALGEPSPPEESDPAARPEGPAGGAVASPLAVGVETGEIDQFLADLLDDPAVAA